MTDTSSTPKTAKAASTKSSTAKTAPFEAFAFPKVEVPEMFRGATEQATKQARESYEKFRTAAEEASDVLEDTFESTRSGFVAVTTKALESAEANTEATFKFAKDMLSVKTFAEAIEMQAAFLRGQYESVTAQMKDLHEIATKAATEAGQPAKDAIAKVTKMGS